MRERPALDHLVAVPGRRLGAAPRDVAGTALVQALRPAAPPHDVAGTALVQALRPAAPPQQPRWTLLLFLGSGCDACGPFWPAAAEPAVIGLDRADALVIVVRETDDLDVVGSLARNWAPAASPVVVSTAAWREFGVHGPPFFALLDGSRVACEGVAWSCAQVAAELRRARDG